MVNITKSGSSLLITSNDNHQFPWKDGQMSIPMNSVTYVIDDSDFIAFKGIANGDILFTANIGEIVINGTQATKDNIVLLFDSVANSVGSGGSSGVEYISTSYVPTEWDTFKGGVKLTNSFTTFDEGDTGYDIFINGNLADGSEAGSLWFGIRSTDNTLKLTDGGGRLDLQVNPDNFKTINGESIVGTGEITISGGEGGVTAINIGSQIQDWTQKTGIVTMKTSFYDGSYDVSIANTSFYGLKPLDGSIILENAGSTVNGNFRCGIKVNEWTGTQAEYDALGTYDENCTYNIIEG